MVSTLKNANWKHFICQECLKCNCHLAPGKVSLVCLSCTWVTSLATRLQVAATSTHLPLPRGSCALHCLLSALIKLSVCACLDFSLSSPPPSTSPSLFWLTLILTLSVAPQLHAWNFAHVAQIDVACRWLVLLPPSSCPCYAGGMLAKSHAISSDVRN